MKNRTTTTTRTTETTTTERDVSKRSVTKEKRPQERQRAVVKLTAGEEKVLRMSRGMKADQDLELEPKTRHPDLLAQLRDIEAKLFIEAGEIGPLSKKSKIIQKLKPR